MMKYNDIHVLIDKNKLKMDVWNKRKLNPEDIESICSKHNVKCKPMNQTAAEISKGYFEDYWLWADFDKKDNLLKAFAELNDNYSVKELKKCIKRKELEDLIKNSPYEITIDRTGRNLYRIWDSERNEFFTDAIGIEIAFSDYDDAIEYLEDMLS